MRLTLPGLFFRAIPLVVLMLFFYGKWGHLQYGIFYDPDGYVRLLRVIQWEESGDWYFTKFDRSNAPEGESNHWSRPLDWILWGGAKLAEPFLGFRTALEYFGIIISPLLFLAVPLALSWMVRPWLEDPQRDFLILCTVGSIDFLLPYFFGRPDHHSLLSLLCILITGIGFRLYQSPDQKSLWRIQGILFTLSLWVSIESLLLLGVFMAPFFFAWLTYQNHSKPSPLSHGFIIFWGTLIFGTVAVLLMETPWHQVRTLQDYDKISIVHLQIFLLLFLYFAGFNQIEKQTIPLPWYLKITGALPVVLYILFVIPEFFKGPMVGIPEKAFSVWLNNIGEVQPLWSLTAYSFFKMTGHLILLFLAFLGARLLFQQKSVSGIGFCLLGATLYTAVGFFQVRWLSYTAIFIFPLAIPYLHRLIQKKYPDLEGWGYRLNKVFIAVLLWILMAAGSLLDDGKNAFQTNPSMGNGASIDLEIRTFAEWLKKTSKPNTKENSVHSGAPVKTPRIMTHLDYGPEILYYSDAEVIGTGYHRNWMGILESYDFFQSSDETLSRSIAQSRGITHVLVTRAPFERDYFKGTQGKPSLHEKLLQNNPPSWLQPSPLKLPSSIQKSLLLYEVVVP